jgi:hypothetical protein
MPTFQNTLAELISKLKYYYLVLYRMKERSLTLLLSIQGEDTAWVTLDFVAPHPSGDDWIGVFSPSNFKYSCSPSKH